MMDDDDDDDDMAISDMPTIHNRTDIENRHGATSRILNNGDNTSSNRTKSVISKGKRTLYDMNNTEDFGQRSPQPSTSGNGGWYN